MRKTVVAMLAACSILCLSAGARAAQLPVTGLTGTGSFNGALSLLHNGVIPTEGSGWTSGTNVWWYGLAPVFTFDFGSVYTIQDMLIQVDNNDRYQVDVSKNGSQWTSLFTIQIAYGEIGYGMDTMSTAAGNPEYVSNIDFGATQGRYIRVYATGGDNMYAISEVQAFGTPPAVPIPGGLVLLGSGLTGLLGLATRKK